MSDVLVPAAVVGALAAILTLRSTEMLLRKSASWFRTEIRKKDLAVVEKLLHAEGVEWDAAGGFRLDGVFGHVSMAHREAARRAALRAAFTERIEPSIFLGALVSAVAGLIAIVHEGPGWYDLGPGLLVVVLIAMFFFNVRESNNASGACAGEISRGLGRRLRTAHELGLRKSIGY